MGAACTERWRPQSRVHVPSELPAAHCQHLCCAIGPLAAALAPGLTLGAQMMCQDLGQVSQGALERVPVSQGSGTDEARGVQESILQPWTELQ